MNFIFLLGGLHGLVFTVTAVIILLVDHKGFNYFRGTAKTLPEAFLKRSHKAVWMGLILMITTGVILTIPAWEYRLSQPVFYAKMGFVLVLVMNAVAIGKLSQKASHIEFALLTRGEKKTLLVSGGLSAMGWIGAAVIGVFYL